ncbi:MAG: insulinase family protein [Acidobacteria bacterium]|nr:insulinase family protein [Acidobacteriota bacterium]
MPSPALPELPADPEAAIPTDPSIRTGKLDNGLTWYARRNGVPSDRVELWLVVNAGALLEDEDQRGLAHFVEHMAFNGTKNFKKQELIDYLEGIGMRFGPDLNAYTSFDETVYLLQVPTDDEATLEKAFLILQDWPRGSRSTRGDRQRARRRARGVAPRPRRGRAHPRQAVPRAAQRLALRRAPPDRSARDHRVGLSRRAPSLLSRLVSPQSDGCRGRGRPRSRPARRPDREILCTAPESGLAARRPRFEIPAHDEALASVATDREQTLTTVSLYLKRPERSEFTHGDYRRSIVEDLAFAMINERLVELSEKADPPFINAFAGAGRFIRGSEVTIANVLAREGQVERGLETALVEVERAARHGFTATELERGKAERLRGMEVAFAERDKEESDGFAGEYVSHFLTGTPSPGIAYELELHRRYLPGITIEEVNRVAATLLDEGSRVVLYSGPEKDGVTHPEGAALLALANAVSTREIAAYVDRVIDAPLVAEPPKPARIVARSVIDAVGVHVWTLENGIRSTSNRPISRTMRFSCGRSALAAIRSRPKPITNSRPTRRRSSPNPGSAPSTRRGCVVTSQASRSSPAPTSPSATRASSRTEPARISARCSK